MSLTLSLLILSHLRIPGLNKRPRNTEYLTDKDRVFYIYTKVYKYYYTFYRTVYTYILQNLVFTKRSEINCECTKMKSEASGTNKQTFT